MKRSIKHLAALTKLPSLLSFRPVRSRANAARTREESAFAAFQESNREGHDFSRAEKPPEIPCALAPEVRFWAAHRFIAAVKVISPSKVLHNTEKPGFVSGYRFTDTITAGKWTAPLGAEDRHPTLVRTVQALILTFAVFLFVAAGPSDDARFKDLGHRMMCTCGCGQVLLECNHVGCQSSEKMRDQLLASIDKGNNDDLILQGFVQEYGPTVIAAPTATGFNRVAWIMPFVVLALGIAFAIHIVRSWKNRPAPALADGITIPQGKELDSLRARARKETDL